VDFTLLGLQTDANSLRSWYATKPTNQPTERSRTQYSPEILRSNVFGNIQTLLWCEV